MADADVIVVGAGLGSLTTAAYLAANGLRPLVLEQYRVAGGCTHTFRRKRAFEFDVGLHYVGDCGPDGMIPTILRGLGADGTIEWAEMDPDGFDTLAFPERTFRVPRGWERYQDRLVDAFPNEARGVRRCADVLERVATESFRMPTPGTPASYALLPVRGRGLLRWAARPLSALFDACSLSPAARAVFTGQSAAHGAAPARASTFMHALMLHHYVGGGAFYPRGGGHMPAAVLLDVITSHGGTVRLRTRVEEIVVRRGAVRGVRLADGELLTAPAVVSGADLKRTFLELIDAEELPSRVRRRVARYRMALPFFCVYLGLDADLRERMPATNIWWHPAADARGHAECRRGAFPTHPFTYVSSATLKDPDNPNLAPPGHSTVEIMTFAPPDRAFWTDAPPSDSERRSGYARDGRYRARKQRIAERLVQLAAESHPALADLPERIVWQEASTPLTHRRFTLSSDGASYGIELGCDQLMFGRPALTTCVDGLYLAGASARYCHGVLGTMMGGVATAGVILRRDLLGEVRAGAVFGDPSRLRARRSGWDPYAACRLGAAEALETA